MKNVYDIDFSELDAIKAIDGLTANELKKLEQIVATKPHDRIDAFYLGFRLDGFRPVPAMRRALRMEALDNAVNANKLMLQKFGLTVETAKNGRQTGNVEHINELKFRFTFRPDGGGDAYWVYYSDVIDFASFNREA